MTSLHFAVGGADDARAQARRILAGRRYRDAEVRRPLQRPMSWIGRRIESFFGWLGRAFDVAVPGSGAVQWVLVTIAAGMAIVWVVRRTSWRRRRAEGTTIERRVDVDALEAEADEAERVGDHRRAVELRFRAGIARLDLANVGASTRTNRQIQPAVVAAFGDLGSTFDAAHYGDAPVSATDVAAARSGWTKVLDATRTRSGDSRPGDRLRRFGPLRRRAGS